MPDNYTDKYSKTASIYMATEALDYLMTEDGDYIMASKGLDYSDKYSKS